mgnify:CR=1 FL=1
MSADGLVPLTLRPLPLGRVVPRGWLRHQLRLQAHGLTGHLDTFWPDVAESGWIGGQAEGWERGPYWLDGVVPLAYLLNDADLLAKVRHWMDYTLTHQQPDGWLGPVEDTATGRYRPYDPWPVFVYLKALTQYQEACGDPRVVPAMSRFFARLESLLAEEPLYAWGQMRWADLVLSLHWMFERTGEARWLRLAETAHRQGFDWRALFADFPHRQRTPHEACNLVTHVVNNAMAIKASGVWYRQSRDEGDRRAAHEMIETLDRYHGQATGVFTGDEHLAGLDPSQGTELCAVVEYMYSLEVLLAVLGEPAPADRLERIAYNALPATISPDLWAHQYDQQANQVLCAVVNDPIYTSNGPDANVFGLEPNYGCCTANMHQGWPKFTAHLWMGTPDGGLAAVSYAPAEVSLPEARAHIVVEGDYPFADEVRLRVAAESPVAFPLWLRIPTWAVGAEVRVESREPIHPEPGTWCRVEGYTWQGQKEVLLRLPARLAVEERCHGAVTVHRGPLVFSLRVGEEWRQIGGQTPHADWEVHPTSPWNYALVLDRRAPERSLRLEERPLGEQPFSPEGAPFALHGKGHRVPQWTLERGAAGPLPQSPVLCTSPEEGITLLPYGSVRLRVTELPVCG